MRYCRLLFCFILLGSLATITGCGWGGDPQDFVVTATPSSVSLQAGAAGQAVSFSIQKVLYFNSAVTVTLSPPSGIACSMSPCTWTTPAGGSQAVALSAASTTPVGSYTVPMHAISGTISHDGSLTVNVLAAATGTQPPPANPVPPAPGPDFTLSVTPSSPTVVAGSAATAYSFQVTRLNGDTAPINVTATFPPGFTCSARQCTATVTGTTLQNAFTLATNATLTPDSYSISFAGTDGTNTHTITVPVTVTAQPVTTAPVPVPVQPATIPSGCRTTPYQGDAPHSPGGLRFTYTGASGSTLTWTGLNHLVYDPGHNVVFETNATLNEVDVISPNTLTLIQRIPVPEPVDLDLSADGSTLYVSSFTQYFYRIDTSLFCVRSSEKIAVNQVAGVPNAVPEYAIPIKVVELSDGSVAILLTMDGSGYGRFAIWTPQGVQVIPSYQNIGYMVRSGDRRHVFLAAADSGGWMGRYDVSTGTVTGKTAGFGSFVSVLAASQDGSRIFGGSDCCQLAIMDSNFNVLVSGKLPFIESALALPDFSRLYLQDNNQNQITVVDGTTLATLGSIPSQTQYAQQDVMLSGFDGTGRILAAVEMGMGAIPVGAPVSNLASTDIRFGPPPYNSGLIPGTPANGLATTLNGAGFTAGADVLFNGMAASSVVWVNTNVLNLTAPQLDADCVDVEALFPNGSATMQPLGYCYRPRILYLAGDAGPAQGGGTLTLYGLGMGDPFTKTTRVLVGGVETAPGQVTWEGVSPYALELSTLQVTVPPGALGATDIQVIAPGGAGSTLLPHTYTYVNRIETALNSSASPVQMIFDNQRSRLLISDKANSQILVYSTTGNQMLTPITTGQSPRGLALTPDRSKLLVLTAGDRKITVLDADNYTVLQQAVIPGGVNQGSFSALILGDPQWVLPLTGGKALVLVEPAYQTGLTFNYDLQTNQLLPNNTLGPSTQGALQGTVSGDGTFAVVDSYTYDAVQETAQRISLYGLDAASIAPDLSRFVSGTRVMDRTGLEGNAFQTYDLLTGLASPLFSTGVGQISSGGSLYYEPTNNGIRIWDMQHGGLRQNVSLPGSESLFYSSTTKLLAVDPKGGRAWTINAHGLIDVQFASDPLSIGSATPAAGQLDVQGSGFSSTMQVSIDGQPVTANVSGTTSFTAALPTLPSGNHAIQITDGPDRAYTLDLAFSTP